MGAELYSILLPCGGVFAVLLIVGFVTQQIAINKVRHEFRAKGFLRVPTGFDLINFLRRKHYELFSNASARILFTISRWCVIGMLLVLIVTLLLCGSALIAKVAPGS